ncbi:MAG: tetratricopeptide repeat protein [Ardenticatenales bacterium]|nr:tetratricopeptide repeat protein [Ardenticatenales bacterium]
MRLFTFCQSVREAEAEYQAISKDTNAEPKLRGCALSYWAGIRKNTRYINRPEGLETLQRIIAQSNDLLPSSDIRRIFNMVNLGKGLYRLRQVDKALACFEEAIRLCAEREDMYGVASVYAATVDAYASRGDWEAMFKARQRGLDALPERARFSTTYGELMGDWAEAWVWAGRYNEAEVNAQTWLSVLRELGGAELYPALRGLGFSLGLQGRYEDAERCFKEACEKHQEVLNLEDSQTLAYWAVILFLRGDVQRAELLLEQSKALKEQHYEQKHFPLIFAWMGLLQEHRGNWSQATSAYIQALNYSWAERFYSECGALTGLARVKHAQGDLDAVPALLSQAEALAQRYEYNDHLASLRLTQGHLAADLDATLHHYQQMLIYALRYNRFLLDEMLSGRPQGTPLRPIIPTCLELGEDGQHLLRALHDWWQSDVNDIGTPRPDTISPIPEGISLLEGERLARQREPGDGSPQRSVLEQLDATLGR